MKQRYKDIIFFIIVACIFAFLVCAMSSCVDEEAERQNFITRTYELVDKDTEVRTHRYLMVENAVETDRILVWKSPTGNIFSCEVGRNSYYKYEKGKRYNFTIDKRISERDQLHYQLRY